MRKHTLLCAVLILGVAHSPGAAADALCDFYKKFSPSSYEANCTGGRGSSRRTKPAASGATFADSFNVNPATMPTDPTPYGIESLNSTIRNGQGMWSPTFSLIKGFQKFGAGISTAGTNTFYSNDVIRRTRGSSEVASFEPIEEAKSRLPNLNFGTSFSLTPKSSKKGYGMSLGLSGRYNKVTSTFGGGFGLIFSRSFLKFGAGITREKVSNLAGASYFNSAFVSTQFFVFELEYTVLKSFGAFNLDPVQIGTLTLNMGRFMAAAAIRRVRYESEGFVTQHHYAVQVFPSRSFSLGFLFNYIPGTNSFAGQFYL